MKQRGNYEYQAKISKQIQAYSFPEANIHQQMCVGGGWEGVRVGKEWNDLGMREIAGTLI